MQVESTAECSTISTCTKLLRYHQSSRPLNCLFFSSLLRQVSLYLYNLYRSGTEPMNKSEISASYDHKLVIMWKMIFLLQIFIFWLSKFLIICSFCLYLILNLFHLRRNWLHQGFWFFHYWWAEVTHGAKNGGHFLKWWAQAYQTNHGWHLGSIVYLHTDTDTCMHICILNADYKVKPVLSGHSKKKTNYRLMQVKSIAECSKGSILQYFQPSFSYHLLLRYLFCLFWVAA